MFQTPLCPSSGAREYCTVGCCLWYLVLWFSHHTYNLKTKAPNTTGSNQLYNTLELLMMGIMVPETYWASNKICNKKHILRLVGLLFPHSKLFNPWFCVLCYFLATFFFIFINFFLVSVCQFYTPIFKIT
jgi:hypothetical protein